MDQSRDLAPTEKLCEKCSSLDFDKLFLKGAHLSRVNLDEVRNVVRRRDCDFCKLITKALLLSWHKIPLQWPRDCGPDDECEWTTCRLMVEGGLVVNGVYDRYCSTLKIDVTDSADNAFAPDYYDPEISLLHADGDRLGSARIFGDVCDFALMRSWLERCRLSHSDVGWPGANVQHLRVIDVQNMRIIEAPAECRYAALSYVWGADAVCLEARLANYRELELEGGLKTDALPLTIQDSIHLLRNLGESYLWVDRLCIVQDGPHKSEQIAQMVDIYRNAAFTIVAAGFDGASAHLTAMTPGSRARATQFSTKVKGLSLVSSTPPLAFFFDRSQWKSRAWTYQEWQFSSRALIFTPVEVFFMCSCGTKCESVVAEQESAPRELQPQKVLGSLGDFTDTPEIEIPRHRMTESNVGMYRTMDWLSFTEDYTKREMTFESDVLLAFWSTMEEFRRTTGVGLVAGLLETDLHIALMWRPRESLRRRDAVTTSGQLFPTWSWCGWVGEVGYEFGELTTEMTTRLEIQWFFVGHDDTLQFLDSGKPETSIVNEAEHPAEEHQDDLDKLEAQFGIRLSIEEYGSNPRSRSDPFHEEEKISNRITNYTASAQFEEFAGRKPTSQADIALAREYMAFENLDGALATEHYLYLSGHYSGEHTPVFKIRKIQEMCSQKLSALKAQLTDRQSPSLDNKVNMDPVLAESGYLVFKAQCASFKVHTNLGPKGTDERSICSFGIYNSHGARAGEVFPNTNDQPPPTQAEFVVLCKQHPHPRLMFMSDDVGERQFGESWSVMRDLQYGVLMIERRNGIAYRIGMGSISMSKWEQEDAVEKLLVLG